MAVIARPDVFGALIARIRSFTEITAFVSTTAGSVSGATTARVADQIKDDWKMPTHAIRLNPAGGPRGDEQVGLLFQRFDVWCYGSSGYEASRVSRILRACLIPDQGEHVTAFILANTRVYDIRAEAEPIHGTDEDHPSWHFYIQPILVRYGSRAA